MSIRRLNEIGRAPGGTLRESGHADAYGLIPLLAVIFFGSIAVVVATFVLSFVLPTRKLSGKTRSTVLALVAVFWGGIIGWYVVVPEIETDWRRTVWKRCEAELASIPEAIQVDGFLDEGAALRPRMLLQLLKERRLAFLEIAVRKPDGETSEIAYPDDLADSVWKLRNPSTGWVRLELSNDKNPTCAELPRSIASSIRHPPFLPDTCITLKFLQAPTARYVLSLDPAVGLPRLQQGRWQILDRTTGKSIASLPTVDSFSWFSSAKELSRSGNESVKDCRAPHTVLVDRLHGTEPMRRRPGEQVLNTELVVAKTDAAELDISGTPLPELDVVVERGVWTKQESDTLFNPESTLEGWQTVVAAAREKGVASYGSKLLDWREHKLVSFAPTSRGNPSKWKVFAVGNGFFSAPSYPNWDEVRSSLLLRYRRDGTLAWAARILPPPASKRSCSVFWPQAVYVTSSHLVLAAPCDRWSIPLNSLPKLD